MLLAAHIHDPIRPGSSWQPDLRASLGLALGCAVILFYSFLGLLHKPAEPDAGASMSLTLAPFPAEPKDRRPRRSAPKPPAPAASIAPLNVEPMPPALDLAILQQQADTAVRDTVQQQQSAGPFLMPPAQRYDDLDRALQALPKPGSKRAGESYRSMYGQTIVKSGDNCTAEQEVQIGPSSGVKARVGFAVACPGEYHPSMADGLAEWARKVAKGNLPPPR